MGITGFQMAYRQVEFCSFYFFFFQAGTPRLNLKTKGSHQLLSHLTPPPQKKKKRRKRKRKNSLDYHQIIHPAWKYGLISLKHTQKREGSKWINFDHCHKPMKIKAD
jgi:hypothetical protein